MTQPILEISSRLFCTLAWPTISYLYGQRSQSGGARSPRQLSAPTQMAALDQGAARRLREALDVLAGGELPECPVCKPPRPRAPSTHPPTAHSNCTRILLQA